MNLYEPIRYDYESVCECSNCKDVFYRECRGFDVTFYPWFSSKGSFPCCSEDCVKAVELENSWEYEEDIQDEFLEEGDN